METYEVYNEEFKIIVFRKLSELQTNSDIKLSKMRKRDMNKTRIQTERWKSY